MFVDKVIFTILINAVPVGDVFSERPFSFDHRDRGDEEGDGGGDPGSVCGESGAAGGSGGDGDDVGGEGRTAGGGWELGREWEGGPGQHRVLAYTATVHC